MQAWQPSLNMGKIMLNALASPFHTLGESTLVEVADKHVSAVESRMVA